MSRDIEVAIETALRENDIVHSLDDQDIGIVASHIASTLKQKYGMEF